MIKKFRGVFFVLFAFSSNSFSDSQSASTIADDLLDDASISASVSYFQRDRKRVDETGNSSRYFDDLDHATIQGAVKFKSDYVAESWGVNFSAYSATDVIYDDALPRNIENEFSFAGKRWGEENTRRAENGTSISVATIKYRHPNQQFRAKIGYAPLNVPGVIGVNWSLQPGNYRGAQLKWIPQSHEGGLTVTYAWADEYKAPWYTHTQKFSALNAWDESPVSSKNRIDFIHGLALSYASQGGQHQWQASVGQSDDFIDAWFVKWAYQPESIDGLSLSYLAYVSDSKNSTKERVVYDGLAWQQGVRVNWELNNWHLKAETLVTQADGLGSYLPRLTKGYANSQGGSEFWWDSRSDWNNDGERAVYAGIWYRFPLLWGMSGWQVGGSAAYGWGANRWVDQVQDKTAKDGSESAINFDLIYLFSHGLLKGAEFRLHLTDYRNHQDRKGSYYYHNMFTSERDIKLQFMMPVSIL